MKTFGHAVVVVLVATGAASTGFAGISGSGASVNGISGSGSTVNGISGSGSTVNGISGSGSTVNGISGSGSTVNGISGSGAQLLVVGPVEATSVADATATILGQRVRTVMAGQLTVGNTVAVFGTMRVDGSITASAIQSRGLYVPGATSIFLFGTIQRADPSLGR